MAAVSVKNHGNANRNPWAHKPLTLTRKDVLASPVVSTPYKRLDCSLISDGAAALVLAAEQSAPAATRPRAQLIGMGRPPIACASATAPNRSSLRPRLKQQWPPIQWPASTTPARRSILPRYMIPFPALRSKRSRRLDWDYNCRRNKRIASSKLPEDGKAVRGRKGLVALGRMHFRLVAKEPLQTRLTAQFRI